VAVSKREKGNKQLAKQERSSEDKKQAIHPRLLPALNTKHTHNPTGQAWQHKAAKQQKSSVVGGAANLTPYPSITKLHQLRSTPYPPCFV
jgi:hypothetical protein